jgi:hypothetical protein
MAGDFPVQLAQLIAQNRQTQAQPIRQPQVQQLNPMQSTSVGWGPVGEAFGKGAGDYINQTYVQAEKNKYMQENDPIEIQKRAEKAFALYSNLSPAEQTKIDKWMNETPEGLKWLQKIQKSASHLLTKEPRPESELLPPGVSKDDREMVRFMRVTPDEKRQKDFALAAMSNAPQGAQAAPQPPVVQPQGAFIQPNMGLAPKQQTMGQIFPGAQGGVNPYLFPEATAHIADARYKDALTTELPFTRSIHQQTADASTSNAASAASEAKSKADMVKDTNAYHRALAAQALTHAQKVRSEIGKMSPEDKAFLLQAEANKNKNIQTELDKSLIAKTSILQNNNTAFQAGPLLIENDLQAGAAIARIDPKNPLSLSMFDNASRTLTNLVKEHDGKRTWTGKRQPLSPKILNLYEDVLGAWDQLAKTPQSLAAFAPRYVAMYKAIAPYKNPKLAGLSEQELEARAVEILKTKATELAGGAREEVAKSSIPGVPLPAPAPVPSRWRGTPQVPGPLAIPGAIRRSLGGVGTESQRPFPGTIESLGGQ